MPKRSKGRSDGQAGSLRDEDYDWIKYLGDGRAAPASSSTTSANAAPSSSAAGSDGGFGPARAALPGGSGTSGTGGFGRRARPALPAGPSSDGPGGQRRGGAAAQERDSAYGRDNGYGRDSGYGRDNGYSRDNGDGSPRQPAQPADGGPRQGGSNAPEPTKPGRAVRVTAGRAQDLEANPAAALFNPAAEEYGQPLYATPGGPDNGYGWSGQPAQQTTGQQTTGRQATGQPGRPLQDETDPGWERRNLDTGEYRRPLYPAQDYGQGYRTGPQPAWHDDPLGDTSPRGRGRGEGPRRQSTGPRALPAAGPRALPAAGPRALPPGRTDAGLRPEPAIVSAPQSANSDVFERPGRAATGGTGTLVRSVPAATPHAPAKAPAKGGKPRRPAKKGRRTGRRRTAFAVVVVIAVAAVAGYLLLWPRTSHVVSTPPKLGGYVRQNASPMAEQFKNRLLASAGSDVKNVVAATYKGSGGPGAASVPPVVVFIGGNLAGNASAGSLISAYISQMHGAFATSAGKLGGRAACAPGLSGGPSECAWADGDTFGVVVSATLGPTALANEMRLMRPLVEHVTKPKF